MALQRRILEAYSVYIRSGLESSIDTVEAHPVSPFDEACAQLDSAVQHYSRRYRRDYSCIRGTLSICVPTLQTECARSTTEASTSTTAWATRRNHMILARAFRIWMAVGEASSCSRKQPMAAKLMATGATAGRLDVEKGEATHPSSTRPSCGATLAAGAACAIASAARAARAAGRATSQLTTPATVRGRQRLQPDE